MTKLPLVFIILGSLAAACVPLKHKDGISEPSSGSSFAHRDYVLTVMKHPPGGCPELVRVYPDSRSVFRFFMPELDPSEGAVDSKHYQYSEAKPGEIVAWSETDFCSRLLSVDYTHQKATLRVYDLSKHL